ncbi:MAG: nitroreductase family deazaflavin-dependent oxidoreductase [Anaerolineales bacterium]
MVISLNFDVTKIEEVCVNGLRRIFWFINRFFMVPLYRLGLGFIVCNPLSGYIMVIKHTGRKSGKRYYTPTNYVIFEGKVYCISGFGRGADWYLNLKAEPAAEIILPGGAFTGRMEEVEEQSEALKICKQIFKNAGFAGFLEGYNPWSAPDEKFLKTLKRAPVLRFRPVGVANGPMDQGGWHWITLIAVILLLVLS